MRIDFLALVQYIREWIYFISCIIDCMSKPKRDLIEKNALLASQLALVNEEIEVGKRPKPKSTPAYRHLWVLLSKFCSDWKEKSIVFSPDTIIRWKKKSDSFHWLIKSSRKRGRPPISLKTRNTIRLFFARQNSRFLQNNFAVFPQGIFTRNFGSMSS